MKPRDYLTVPHGMLADNRERRHYTDPEIRQEMEADKFPLYFFTADQAQVIAAACEHIFPADGSSAGAREAGVIFYIDYQLAGPYGRGELRYSKAPFVESTAEHGYQRPETPQEIYQEGLKILSGFCQFSSSQQMTALERIQDTDFFQLLRAHTIEGMFCDPVHRGNVGLVGWRLIGFPGPQMNYQEEIDQHYGEKWTRLPSSLSDVADRKSPLADK